MVDKKETGTKLKKESKPKTNNKMKEIKIEKVTLNMGIGVDQDKLELALKLLEKISGKKPVKTISNKRIATWKIRPGLPLGLKVTLRKKAALEILKRMLKAVDSKIKKSSFTENGFSFGVKEYIDIPGAKYDPKAGMLGLDVCVTLRRPGFRIKKRKLHSHRVHSILAEEAMNFAEKQLEVKIE